MYIQRLSQTGCFASARSWRAHAEILRANAQASHLCEKQRQLLACEAEAADRQAGMWLDAAEEA
jgi:hypothetical protein